MLHILMHILNVDSQSFTATLYMMQAKQKSELLGLILAKHNATAAMPYQVNKNTSGIDGWKQTNKQTHALNGHDLMQSKMLFLHC